MLLITMGTYPFTPIFAQRMTEAEAAEEAQKSTNGKVIKVLNYDNEREGYNILVLSEGKVREIFIKDKKP